MENNNPTPQKRSFPWITVILLLFLVLILILSFSGNKDDKKISYTEFEQSLINHEIAKIDVVGNVAKGVYVSGKTNVDHKNFPKEYDFYFTYLSSTSLMDLITEYNADPANAEFHVDANYDLQPESIWSIILPFLYIGLVVVLAIVVIRSLRRMNGKGMDFGKNKARVEANLKVRFDDVAGCEEEKREMQEIVEFLKNPKKFTDLGARIPKGVLLVGPPGTGKTLLAKAIAGEAGVPFFSITGSDFVEMFVGVGAARVRDLFETAKRNIPCMIFIDEIDAVGRQRGTGLGNTNDEREQTLNQLLVQMDGFENSEGMVVIAATNRPDVLDPALLRAGRFDRRIVVNAPDLKAREKILRLYAKNKPIAENVNFESVARVLAGATGADIENIINEAAILAARDNRAVITQSDIMEGISKATMGPQKRSAMVTEQDRLRTAYHEAGHAIIARSSPNLKNEVQEVSIIPRGIAGGYTAHTPTEEPTQFTKAQIIDHIEIAMGGRAAEIIKYGTLGTGASNDIKESTKWARRMVTEFGMSEKLGPVCYAGEEELFLGRDFQARNNISEHTSQVVDEEIKKIAESALDNAVKRLKEKKDVLEEMVKVLIEKETIYADEIDMLLDGKKAKEVIELMTKREAERAEIDRKAREEKQRQDEELRKTEEERARILREKALAAFNGAHKDEKIGPSESETQEPNKDDVKTEEKTDTNEDILEVKSGEEHTVIKEPKSQVRKKSAGSKAATKKDAGTQTKDSKAADENKKTQKKSETDKKID